MTNVGGQHPGKTEKSVTQKLIQLPQGDRVMVEYIWIDGTDEAVRSKCKTMDFEPMTHRGNGNVIT